MTPEEILNDYFRDSGNDVDDAYEIAIEAIKQYAREMCDKQKQNCNSMIIIDGYQRELLINAPYPKELL